MERKKVHVRLWVPLVVVVFSVLFLSHYAFAQTPLVRMEIPSSPNPVGSGARALGIGGAFIAVADDATAASWNPGGLIQLEKPEVSIVGSYVNLSEDNSFGGHPEASGKQSVSYGNLNYLSGAYPFKLLNRNMIVSLNYQHLYDFHRKWNFNYNYTSPISTTPAAYNYEQNGALYALGLAYSVEIVPTFSLGATLNYWGDGIYSNKWEQVYNMSRNINLGGTPGFLNSYKKETFSFSGWNANLGFLWKMTGKWTLGGVFKTPFKASITHEIQGADSMTFPTFPAADTFTAASRKYYESLNMPMSYGLGLAYRFSDNFSVAGDFYRTHWRDYVYENYQGIKTSPINGLMEGDANIAATTWFHLGCEYLFIKEKFTVPVRAGVFYDPVPAQGSPDNVYGIAFGTGIAYKRFIFDVAYQYRWANDLGKSSMAGVNFSQNIQEHTVYASAIIHF